MSQDVTMLSPIYMGLATIPYQVPLISGATEATSCYFILQQVGGDKIVTWKYVQGGSNNDATIETISGTKYWQFQKDGNWTKETTNIVPGDYDVIIQVGEIGSTTFNWFEGVRIKVSPSRNGSAFVPTI